MAGSTIDGSWQIELQGVNMDACDITAPLFIQKWLSGMGVPKLRGNDKPRPQAAGVYPSPRYLPARSLLWSLGIHGATAAAVQASLALLAQAFAPIPDSSASFTVPLVFTLADPTVQYLVNGVPERLDTNYDMLVRTYRQTGTLSGAGQANVPYTKDLVCEFTATDPVIYLNVLNSLSTGLGSSTGGLAFPFAFPFSFGTSTPGQVLATNTGTVVTYPVITITAGGSGLSGIQITKVATGEVWSITLTMSAGDTLTIDMGTHTVLLNGTASRANVVNRPPSVWFGLDPSPTVAGGINTIQWTATGAGSTMAVAWRSAFLV